MESVQAWATVGAGGIAALALLVAVLGYFFSVRPQLRGAQNSREAQWLTDISRRWEEGQVFKARARLVKLEDKRSFAFSTELSKMKEERKPELLTYMSIPNFYEDLAVLIREGVIRIQIAQMSIRRVAGVHWRMYQPYIEARRVDDRER